MSQNRWEKISKKYEKDPGLTTESVKKFLALNFTQNIHEELCGNSKKPTIDPGLIMDIRHDSVKIIDLSYKFLPYSFCILYNFFI